jgi:AcrR family transcriptional regulator
VNPGGFTSSPVNTVSADATGLPRAIDAFEPEDRILWATVRLASEKGFESVRVFDVIERAEVSRANFYELFDSRDECLFAAYERVLDVLFACVARAYEGNEPWPVKIRRALGACLAACSAEPEVTRMATVEVPAARPEAQRRYGETLRRFVPLLTEGRRYREPGGDLPSDLELMAVGGAEAIIHEEVLADRTEELPAKLPDILFTVLAPYIGPEAAAAEARRAEQV